MGTQALGVSRTEKDQVLLSTVETRTSIAPLVLHSPVRSEELDSMILTCHCQFEIVNDSKNLSKNQCRWLREESRTTQGTKVLHRWWKRSQFGEIKKASVTSDITQLLK